MIGRKWKCVILFHLIENTLRYNEWKGEIPSITKRTLSLILKELEA
jgi:DNA-binding HxlR family transcriptional regulator